MLQVADRIATVQNVLPMRVGDKKLQRGTTLQQELHYARNTEPNASEKVDAIVSIRVCHFSVLIMQHGAYWLVNRSSLKAKYDASTSLPIHFLCFFFFCLLLLQAEQSPDLAPTQHACNFIPEASQWLIIHCFVSVNAWLLPDKIRFVCLDKLRLLQDLPERECENRNEEHSVVDDEVLSVPWREAGVSVEQDHKGRETKTQICRIWLEVTTVWEGLSIEALGFACSIEEDEGNAYDDVVDDTARGDEVDKPAEDNGAAAGD